jgi:hypothetical protein
VRRFLRENSLSLFFGALFLAALVAQAFVGHAEFNQEQIAHHDDPISLWRYVLSSAYGVDVLENWQSEYLQFTLYVVATVWFVQRGSPESKPVDEAGPESDQKQKVGGHAGPRSPSWARAGDWRTRIYSHSLLLLMATLFFLSWLGQGVTGRITFNSEQFDHHQAALGFLEYLGTPDFWNRTLQNWQSEFLAVGCMAVFSIYLRERGSPESKPVGAPHDATGVEG